MGLEAGLPIDDQVRPSHVRARVPARRNEANMFSTKEGGDRADHDITGDSPVSGKRPGPGRVEHTPEPDLQGLDAEG